MRQQVILDCLFSFPNCSYEVMGMWTRKMDRRGLKELHPCEARLCEKGRAWSDFLKAPFIQRTRLDEYILPPFERKNVALKARPLTYFKARSGFLRGTIYRY